MRGLAQVSVTVIAAGAFLGGQVGAQATSLAIELLAPPAGYPERPMVPVADMWSMHDYADSVVVRVRIGGVSAATRGAVVAHLQYKAARRIPLADNTDVMDPDATDSAAVWLPASAAMKGYLRDARVIQSGELELDIGSFAPLSAQTALEGDDPDLVLTAVRIVARLIRQGNGQYHRADSAELELWIAF